MKKGYFSKLSVFLVTVFLVAILIFTISKNTKTENSFSYIYEDKDYIEGQIIVSLNGDADINKLVRDFSNINLRVKERLIPDMNIYLLEYDISKSSAVDALISLKSKHDVSVAQFNHNNIKERTVSSISATTPNDTRFSEQWDMNNTGQTGGTPDADIDAPEAWDIATGGNTALGDTIVVAVVDGGGDLANTELSYWKNYGEIPGNGIDDDGNGYIDDVNGWSAINNNGTIPVESHSTHVAGTVGAKGNNGAGVTGVNWKVKVMAVHGSTSSEAVAIKAYGYVYKQRKLYNETNGVKGAFVVSTNSSFGVDNGQPSSYPLWCAFYDSLGRVGVLSAGAGPNNNVNIDVVGDIPTACPSPFMIAVTNTTNTDVRNSGAGYGPINMDLGAPGTNILSTLPNNTFGLNTGTSMATPHVAGAVGLMFNAAGANLIQLGRLKPDSLASYMKFVMLSTVDTLASLNTQVLSKGRLNLFKAVNKVKVANVPVLNAFNLTSPTAGTTVTTFPGSQTNITFTWDTSATGATYKFIFGSPSATNRQIQVDAGTNSFTIKSGTLDSILANLGVASGSSLVGSWDVYAKRLIPVNDSLKAANGPRTVTLARGLVTVSPFALVQPANNTTLITAPNDNSNVNISWRSGGAGIKYKWQFDSPSFAGPVILNIPSGNNSFDTTITLVNSALDGMLQAYGLNRGDSLVGQWKVYAFRSPTDSTASSETRNLTLRRVGTLLLNESFENATFPPAEWSTAGTGTIYWVRSTGTGGYGNGTASAKYDFWTATASTGAQSLVSNQFPAVTSPTNYLRFNYACAYYSATSIDSCIVETSTDAGTTWTRLLGMYQSASLTSGYNSSPVMSTVSSTSSFTPTASQWATKILSMPVGTNKIRLTAKSAYGNNLYIDNITSGTVTGIGNQLTLTPEKYELSQNYPNPFNPTTKISYSIPKAGIVTMKIFDVTGREVASLVNELMQPGAYTVDFNASAFASGVYFYRLEAQDFIDTKRMVLLK
ncbi:MAG: S8 family peptidase [Bacteroidetes bacterium]|nr:S8 family peptidase [Bacteroidota bacterium]